MKTRLLLLLLMTASCHAPVQGQTGLVPPVPTPTNTGSSLSEAVAGLNALIDSSRAARKRQETVNDPSAAESTDFDGELQAFSAVLGQVKALQQLKRSQAPNTAAPNNPNAMATGNAMKPTGAADPSSKMNPSMETTGNPIPSANATTAPAATGSLTNITPGEAASATKPGDFMKRMLDKPVDPIRMAQSLYKTGNYEAAIHACNSLDEKTASKSDIEWAKFLNSLCLNHLGHTEQAVAKLREMSNAKEKRYSAEVKWWLDHYERLRSRKAQVSQVIEKADALSEEANNYVRNN